MSRLPRRFAEFLETYPDVGRAYRELSEATESAGPLDGESIRLVKLAIAVGTRQESAVRSHARRALESGCRPDQLRHAVLLATTTIGFSSMMTVLGWVEDMISRHQSEAGSPKDV